MSPIRVLLAEDHTLVRTGIRALLQLVPEVEIVAEASDGLEALHLIELHHPDIVLLDIGMPQMSGLEVLRATQHLSSVRVVMLSMYAGGEYVLQALRDGAAGYLLKDASMGELELALKAVARGESYLSPAVSKHVISGYVQHGAARDDPLAHLTARQREILQLIASGSTTRQIARLLGISVKTVEKHRTLLMERLDIHDVAGLVRYAIRVGLVKPDS